MVCQDRARLASPPGRRSSRIDVAQQPNSGGGTKMRIVRMHRDTLLALTLLLLAACRNELLNANKFPAQLARMDVVSGNDQYGSPGEMLPQPIVVLVTGAGGTPVSGQIVNFRVVSGGGSVFAGTSMTNSSGIAKER